MNVVITGASKGIGKEMVKVFASSDNHTIVAISRNREKLDQLKDDCHQANREAKVIPVAYDLTELSSDDRFVEREILPHFGHIDILINNAGFLENAPFTDTLPAKAAEMVAVNYSAPAELIRILMDYMGKSGLSHVVNISSMGGVQGSVKFGGLAHYSASKSALATLTECLAEEYKERDIRFNCLSLGAVQTEMLAEAFPGYKAPLRAVEAAEFIVDFAMRGSKFFNGKILPVSVSTP